MPETALYSYLGFDSQESLKAALGAEAFRKLQGRLESLESRLERLEGKVRRSEAVYR